jgi:hypothetical protein
MTEQRPEVVGARRAVRADRRHEMGDPDEVDLEFSARIWHWRGPAPYVFVTVPEPHSRHLHEVARAVTYGWGMVPVLARIGETEWETSLFPKDGGYVVPLKDAVRRAERVDEGDSVTVRLIVADPR